VEELLVGVAEFGQGGVEFDVEGVIGVSYRPRFALCPVDQAKVTAARPAVVGDVASSDPVGPGQSGVDRHIVQPAPESQHRLRHDVVDCIGVDAPTNVSLNRLIDLRGEGLEALSRRASVRRAPVHAYSTPTEYREVPESPGRAATGRGGGFPPQSFGADREVCSCPAAVVIS
jgi:hypothetical protein